MKSTVVTHLSGHHPKKYPYLMDVVIPFTVYLCLVLFFVSLTGCGGGAGEKTTLYSVGRTAFDWTDSSRIEKYGPTPGGPRKIVVYVWYPASPAAKSTTGPILTESQATMLGALGGISRDTILSIPSKSYINAPVVRNNSSFPVLLLSHANTGSPILYSNTAEYLAAHGYIVVGISHVYNTNWTVFSDNSIVLTDPATDPTTLTANLNENSSFADLNATFAAEDKIDADLTKDCPFVLDKLEELNRTSETFRGRLRMDKIGMFGHSFGGSHTFRMLQEDSRILAGADLDGTLYNLNFAKGTTKPFLVISGERPSPEVFQSYRDSLIARGMTKAEADTIIQQTQSERIAYEASPNAYFVKLPQAKHENFSDFGILAAYGFPQENISTMASPESILNLSNEYLLGFFNEKLLGRTAPILHQSPKSADIIFESSPRSK